MQRRNQIAILGLILLFFFSTSGATIYKHYCYKINSSSLSLFASTNLCNEHNEQKQQAKKNHSCCTDSKQIADHYTEDCCDDEIGVLKINADIINYNGEIPFTVLPFVPFISHLHNSPYILKKQNSSLINSPPLISTTTKEALSSIQVYLI